MKRKEPLRAQKGRRRSPPPWRQYSRLSKKQLRQEITDSCCGKDFRFATEQMALHEAARIDGCSSASVRPGRVYQCDHGWWHMSSAPQRHQGNDVTASVRKLVLGRDKASCAWCGNALRSIYSIHHRLPRGRGGRNGPDNLLALCGSGTTGCHGLVESHRTEAYAKGFLVKTGQQPVAVTVQHALYGPVLLLEDGTVKAAA